MKRPKFITDKMLEYLDSLRESGTTNMFGASPYVKEAFPILDKTQSNVVLRYWMDTFFETEQDDLSNKEK